MENLVNKKVRLRNQKTRTTLVARSDKKSVSLICEDNDKPKPKNSVWIIKSKHPDKSIQLESVYGKLLAWKPEEGVIQVDRPPSHSTAVESGNNLWKFVDVNQSGFTYVQILSHVKRKRPVYLYLHEYPGPSISYNIQLKNTQLVVGYKEFSWWISWMMDPYFIWDLEIVEDPITDPGPGLVTSKSEDNPPVTVPTPSTSYIYQVDRMYVYNQEGMAGTSFPFSSTNANSGRNVNNSGTQIVGGVNVQTHIDNLINKQIVKRNA